MARDDHGQQAGEEGAEFGMDIGGDGFLARMAAREQPDRPVAEGFPHFLQRSGIGGQGFRRELQVAKAAHIGGAEQAQALGLRLRLGQAEAEDAAAADR